MEKKNLTLPYIIWPNLTETNIFFYVELSYGEKSAHAYWYLQVAIAVADAHCYCFPCYVLLTVYSIFSRIVSISRGSVVGLYIFLSILFYDYLFFSKHVILFFFCIFFICNTYYYTLSFKNFDFLLIFFSVTLLLFKHLY